MALLKSKSIFFYPNPFQNNWQLHYFFILPCAAQFKKFFFAATNWPQIIKLKFLTGIIKFYFFTFI